MNHLLPNPNNLEIEAFDDPCSLVLRKGPQGTLKIHVENNKNKYRDIIELIPCQVEELVVFLIKQYGMPDMSEVELDD